MNDCKAAAKYINEYMKKRLYAARQRLSSQGLHGQSRSRKYEPFAAIAPIVVEYFRLFTTEHKGNIGATARHIEKFGPYYPDWDSPEFMAEIKALEHRGFKVYKPPASVKHDGKYYPTENQLKTMFTNAMYPGHWVIKGNILCWNNHPALVPEDLFLAAFNYLSPVTLEGETNPDYRPHYNRIRTKGGKGRDRRPFLEGLIYSPNMEGVMRPMSVCWSKEGREKGAYFLYAAISVKNGRVVKTWRKRADYIDDLIHNELRGAMFNMTKNVAINDALDKQQEKDQRDSVSERRRLEWEIQDNQRRQRNIIINLADDTNPDRVRGLRDEYDSYEADIEKKREKIKALDEQVQDRKQINQFRAT
jgi:hypothetical protein